MYYETNQVNNILICQHCQAQLERPKILPCGETICSFCVSSIQINLNLFDCLVCKQQHEMPKNGLPDNRIALKMLSVKPTKVSRGKAVDYLEKSLDEILKKYRLIKYSIENSADLVKEYFIDLRSDVQLKTEEAIQQINDISSKIIEEIDEHEKELIEFNKTNSKILTFNIELLKKDNIDEKLVAKSIKEAASLTKKAEFNIQNLKDIIFDGKLFIFKKNSDKINKSILGVEYVFSTNIDSIILTGRDQIKDLITICDFQISKKFILIYRASQDGFKAKDFHSKCDKQPNTLILIKSKHGNIFGGYTEQDWTANDDRKFDEYSFVFSLINKYKMPLKLKCLDADYIYCGPTFGPVFGNVIVIADESNRNIDNASYVNYAFYHEDSLVDENFLAGSQYFKVIEIEAFILE